MAVLLAYYAAWVWLIYFPPAWAGNMTGATAESGPRYGFWSGFGGTLIFSAAILFPPWYWRHTCHHAWWCLRWGAHEAAGGMFRLCRVHHPDLQGQRPHKDLIAELHSAWKRK